MALPYPGDPGSHPNATRAWQDRLLREGRTARRATGVMSDEVDEALKELRRDLGAGNVGPRKLWDAWNGPGTPDEGSSEPDVDLGEDGAADGPGEGDEGDGAA